MDDSKSSWQGDGNRSRSTFQSNYLPEIIEEIIRERINHTRLKINPAKVQAILKVTHFSIGNAKAENEDTNGHANVEPR